MTDQESDLSGLVLIAANLLTIILAVVLQYNFGVIIWSYWTESVIIGIFTAAAMLLVGLMSKNIRGWFWVFFNCAFFTVHYGMFHLFYVVFLIVLPWFSVSNWMEIVTAAGILFTSHLFSFIYNNFFKKQYLENKTDDLMMRPYSRIVPIHLTMMLSGFVLFIFPDMGALPRTILLVVFMSLKTIGDLIAHQKKHQLSLASTK